jgi:tetratricopeptide (TPR) repeat protein
MTAKKLGLLLWRSLSEEGNEAMRESDIRRRAAVTLLHNVRSRHALARHPLFQDAYSTIADQLPTIVTLLLEELSSESDRQRRRFTVLRKSDIERENHAAIAYDMSLSRSQFYRDLREARERFTDALEDRLSLQTTVNKGFNGIAQNDVRFTAIVALRDSGQFERAYDVALALARDSGEAGRAIRALCVCAELQTELGSFAEARRTTEQARALLANVADNPLKNVLNANCDLVEFELAHCQGKPAAASVRNLLIERLRFDYSRDDSYTETLVKALVEEASILFEQGDDVRSLAIIEEASSIVARERLAGTRLAVDVAIRASGIRALHADQVSRALEETAKIAEAGNRNGDVRSLRVGMQMMSAHLLTLGRFEEAKRFALEASALIDLFGSTLDRIIMFSNLARIDIHRRDGRAALEWIKAARALPCDPFSISQALAISEAEALTLLGQPGRAAEMAHSLGVRVRNWPRLLGRAKLAEATALAALNREREARAYSEEAVELSRGAAGPLLHLRALELCVKLGGNSASRAALRGLQAALNS